MQLKLKDPSGVVNGDRMVGKNWDLLPSVGGELWRVPEDWPLESAKCVL